MRAVRPVMRSWFETLSPKNKSPISAILLCLRQLRYFSFTSFPASAAGSTGGSSLSTWSKSRIAKLRTRRHWKPNVQEKQLFSYILDRQIQVKVTTHALCCIDKAGGIDEYFLKTPYHKMDTEMGLVWKAKIEKLYEEVGQTGGYAFLQPKDEAKVEQEFKELKLDEREVKRQMYGWSKKLKQIEERKDNQISDEEGHEEGAGIGEGSSHVKVHEQMVANS